jgi:hypothetical protein
MANRVLYLDDELAPQGMIVPGDPPTAEQAAQREPIELPVYNFPSWDSLFFDRVGVIATPALGATATVVAFAMPAGYTGLVRWLSNIFLGAGFTDGSGNLVWRVLRDAQAVEDYENITAQLGTLPIPTDTFIPVQENQTVSITITTVVLPGAGTSIGGRLKGWRWPSTRRIK